jgi:hypothetical protein
VDTEQLGKKVSTALGGDKGSEGLGDRYGGGGHLSQGECSEGLGERHGERERYGSVDHPRTAGVRIDEGTSDPLLTVRSTTNRPAQASAARARSSIRASA